MEWLFQNHLQNEIMMMRFWPPETAFQLKKAKKQRMMVKIGNWIPVSLLYNGSHSGNSVPISDTMSVRSVCS
jgi:hypothetical protein